MGPAPEEPQLLRSVVHTGPMRVLPTDLANQAAVRGSMQTNPPGEPPFRKGAFGVLGRPYERRAGPRALLCLEEQPAGIRRQSVSSFPSSSASFTAR